MHYIKSKITILVAFTWLIEVSSLLLTSKLDKFALERYTRSRNKTITEGANLLHGPTLDFVGLANHYGYPAEEHVVITVDGYRLRIHRIPGSRSIPKGVRKPIVYFQHGLLSSSDSWILLGPDYDLDKSRLTCVECSLGINIDCTGMWTVGTVGQAYMLADKGYDVWLGNVRGNTYSRSHLLLSPDNDPQFWQYSFHEMAIFDTTASIDYILHETDQKSIIYIGHSMGTTISFILLSTKPEYNNKIKFVINLSPVAFWHGPLQPVMKFLRRNVDPIKNLLYKLRIYEILPLTPGNIQLVRTACGDKSIFQQLCLNLESFLFGYNPSQINTTLLSYIFSYFPSGTSRQTIDHFSQILVSGQFRMYDYGLIHNFAVYKQKEPPSYNLKNIVAPVALFYGKGDGIVSAEDVFELATILPNVATLESVPHERFSHLDFQFSRDIKTLLNDRLMEIIKQYT